MILGMKWNGIKVTNNNVTTFSFEFGHLLNGQDLPMHTCTKVNLTADAQLNHLHNHLACLVPCHVDYLSLLLQKQLTWGELFNTLQRPGKMCGLCTGQNWNSSIIHRNFTTKTSCTGKNYRLCYEVSLSLFYSVTHT
jgi:hypothetical protein